MFLLISIPGSALVSSIASKMTVSPGTNYRLSDLINHFVDTLVFINAIHENRNFLRSSKFWVVEGNLYRG